MLLLYKAQIHTHMKNCSYVWTVDPLCQLPPLDFIHLKDCLTQCLSDNSIIALTALRQYGIHIIEITDMKRLYLCREHSYHSNAGCRMALFPRFFLKNYNTYSHAPSRPSRPTKYLLPSSCKYSLEMATTYHQRLLVRRLELKSKLTYEIFNNKYL